MVVDVKVGIAIPISVLFDFHVKVRSLPFTTKVLISIYEVGKVLAGGGIHHSASDDSGIWSEANFYSSGVFCPLIAMSYYSFNLENSHHGSLLGETLHHPDDSLSGIALWAIGVSALANTNVSSPTGTWSDYLVSL